MKNQNKILMSLLTASVAALASAPALADKMDSQEQNQFEKIDGVNSNFIDFKYVADSEVQLTEEEILIKNDIKAQVEAMLTKKAPIMKISESIDIVVESYGKNNETIKQQIFEDLQLGATPAYCGTTTGAKDSTCLTITTQTNKTGTMKATCHATCHTACHGACHGSRGWR